MVHIVQLGIVCTALIVQVTRGCPNGWKTFDGSCYFVSDMIEDWSAATTTCGLYNAHLAEIKDVHEDNFLKQIIIEYHNGHRGDTYFWLGATDTFVEGDWKWLENGERVTYTNWYPGEPNNHHSHGEDCLVAHIIGHNVHWKDNECTNKYPFVCEIGGSSSGIVIG